jgi:DNA-binding transcriptional MerR regulator
MRIGELADRIGVSTDTLRFYEKAGWLPHPRRAENGYRQYRDSDVEHLRLLIDLRRLEIPLDDAAQLASWCHLGHCGEMSDALPAMLSTRRLEIIERVRRLLELDARLADLERHVGTANAASRGRTLPVLEGTGACCDAAAAVMSNVDGGCASCSTAMEPSSEAARPN